MQRGSLPVFGGASPFGWEFKQWKVHRRQKVLRGKKGRKSLNIHSTVRTLPRSLCLAGGAGADRGWGHCWEDELRQVLTLCAWAAQGDLGLTICASSSSCLPCTLCCEQEEGSHCPGEPSTLGLTPDTATAKNHPTAKAPRGILGFLEGLCGTPVLNQNTSMASSVHAVGEGGWSKEMIIKDLISLPYLVLVAP